MVQYAFYFDSNRCTGCKTCQVACKETYSLPTENLWRHVIDYQGGTWTPNEATGGYVGSDVFGYRISMACNHCTDAACVANCPTGAMQKDSDTGIVWTDPEVCIGCKTCQTVCPYGAPSYLEAEGIMSKCDMCKAEVLDDGIPICVSGCPMRALDFGTREDMIAAYGEGDIEIEPLPKNTTNPNMIMTPHRDAQATGAGTGTTVNLPEEM